MCQVHILACTKTHFVKIKVAELGAIPSLFTMNKHVPIDKVTLQTGYIWDTLHINWDGIVITHSGTVVKVREHISVPLVDRFRMRRIFCKTVEYNIMVQQGDTWLSVPVTGNVLTS